MESIAWQRRANRGVAMNRRHQQRTEPMFCHDESRAPAEACCWQTICHSLDNCHRKQSRQARDRERDSMRWSKFSLACHKHGTRTAGDRVGALVAHASAKRRARSRKRCCSIPRREDAFHHILRHGCEQSRTMQRCWSVRGQEFGNARARRRRRRRIDSRKCLSTCRGWEVTPFDETIKKSYRWRMKRSNLMTE